MNQNNGASIAQNNNAHLGKSLEREFGSIETRINILEKNFDTQRRETEMKIENQKRESDLKFDKVDNKIDLKFKEVDIKLDSMKNEFNARLATNFKTVTNNFNNINENLNSIEDKLDILKEEKTYMKGFLKAVTIVGGILIASGGVITLIIKVIYPYIS